MIIDTTFKLALPSSIVLQQDTLPIVLPPYVVVIVTFGRVTAERGRAMFVHWSYRFGLNMNDVNGLTLMLFVAGM